MVDVDGAATEIEREYRRALADFLNSPKQCAAQMRWRGSKNRSDYFIAQLRVTHANSPRIRARIMLHSHVYFEPRKYSFSLLYGLQRIVSLNIYPRRGHTNLLQRRTIRSTHWSYYPLSDVIPDDRSLSHRNWLDKFCEKCNIIFSGSYSSPVHDEEQLRFLL